MENQEDIQEFQKIYDRYKSMLYKIAYTYVKNQADTEDILQEVFIKYLYSASGFASDEHEKRWFIRVTVNLCKNHLTAFWNRNRCEMPEREAAFLSRMDDGSREFLEEVLNLPDKCKAPIYLHYYEGYSCREISEILHVKESTVKMRMKKGRELLKLELEKEGIFHEERTVQRCI